MTEKGVFGQKLNRILIIEFLLIFWLSIYCEEQDNVNYIESVHLQLQYAGNIGLISLGLGKSFLNEDLSFTLAYGVLPHFVNGVTVHTLAFKSRYNFREKRLFTNFLLGEYAGATLLRGFTRNTFVNLGDCYPRGYYVMNAIHISIFAGIRCKFQIIDNQYFKNVSAFCEFGTIDYMIRYALASSYITFWDLWDLSFGVNFDLTKIKF